MDTQDERAGKRIELMAPEVDEILSRPPQGLLQWGSGWVIAILFLLLAVSYFIHFPEYVEATATITTARPPLWLTARVTSRIKELYAGHLSLVKQGQLIAVLENPALESHVLNPPSTRQAAVHTRCVRRRLAIGRRATVLVGGGKSFHRLLPERTRGQHRLSAFILTPGTQVAGKERVGA